MYSTTAQESPEPNLAVFYKTVRDYTVTLCEPLEIEDYVPQPIVDVSPVKWNIAHTTWFFEEMILAKYVPGYRVFNENYGYLFNSYYDSVGERTLRHQRGDLSRPTVRDIFKYREHVDVQMSELIANNPPIDVRELIVLGLNHEQQHQELLLTDLKYTLSLNPFFPVYRDDFALVEAGDSGSDQLIGIDGGVFEIGFNGEGFHFDNELGRHSVLLNDFEIRESLVTNGEYLEFINDGGYSNFRLWPADGWEWVNANQINSPLYWNRIDSIWNQFTLAGLRKIRPENPVCHISYYEASAFAEWKGMRLPTEFEWEAASDLLGWGSRWEWTNSAYLPYPNFKIGTVGEYNGKFMVNQMVLRGGSVATPKGHSRKSYRNFFGPPLRWQFTGIRLAVSK